MSIRSYSETCVGPMTKHYSLTWTQHYSLTLTCPQLEHDWKLCHSNDLIKWLVKNILFKELCCHAWEKHHTKLYTSSSCTHRCNLKAHFRYWGSGSKFLGTNLNSFEANWTLALNLAVGPIYGSHPIGLLYFIWPWTSVSLPCRKILMPIHGA
jgi:hypothetical protein